MQSLLAGGGSGTDSRVKMSGMSDCIFPANLFTLDEYIQFLDDLQEIFGPFKVSKKIMNTRFNKL